MLMSNFVSPAHGVGALDQADGKSCPYCGTAMVTRKGGERRPTRDHVLPRCRGGTIGADNILVVCFTCNGDKGDRTLGEFLLALAQVNDPRSYRIAMLISSLYATMDTHAADRMVASATARSGSTGSGHGRKCYLPTCKCIGHCQGMLPDAPTEQRDGDPSDGAQAC